MKNLILSFALLLAAISVYAQKIYIPNVLFRSWLQNNYASCMDGDSLITNCSEVLNATYVDVSYNNIADLTGIEAFTALDTLLCNNNQLTSLNVSANAALTYLNCFANQLTSLNVKNGNNINITSFYTKSNPNLTCINVDNAAWSTSNWTVIDSWASFSENCYLNVNSGANNPTEINVYPNPTDGIVILQLTDDGLNNKVLLNILDITGKTVFTEILAKESTLKQVDLSNLPKGIYAVKVTSGEVVKVSRIVVQ